MVATTNTANTLLDALMKHQQLPKTEQALLRDGLHNVAHLYTTNEQHHSDSDARLQHQSRLAAVANLSHTERVAMMVQSIAMLQDTIDNIGNANIAQLKKTISRTAELCVACRDYNRCTGNMPELTQLAFSLNNLVVAESSKTVDAFERDMHRVDISPEQAKRSDSIIDFLSIAETPQHAAPLAA